MKTLRAVVAFTIAIVSFMANAQNRIEISANGQTMTATLADTEAASELKQRLEEGSITVSMNDYGGFEKVGALPWSLPADNRQITTSAGDIMLYQGHNVVIFYGSNSWAYTPLGKIENASADEIRNFLSGASLDVTFSLKVATDINSPETESGEKEKVFNLNGERINIGDKGISGLPKGIYIINGKTKVFN